MLENQESKKSPLTFYLYNELLSSSYGRDSKRMMQQASYENTFYEVERIVCVAGSMCHQLPGGRAPTAEEALNFGSYSLSAATLVHPVGAGAKAIQLGGLGVDLAKAALTNNYWGLIPTLVGSGVAEGFKWLGKVGDSVVGGIERAAIRSGVFTDKTMDSLDPAKR